MVSVKVSKVWEKDSNGNPYPRYELTTVCPICGEEHKVVVNTDDYFAWNSLGWHTQDAFPYLSDNEREMLISGVCPTCWDSMFGSDDEDEYEEPDGIDDDMGYDPYLGCFTGDC